MRSIIKNRLGRARKDQRGFTLIEMLVVVGIIVALAAIIVPLVISFSGKGEEAAKVAELEALQIAIQAMMAEYSLSTVQDRGPLADTVLNDFVFDPGPPVATLELFMDQPETQFCYTWEDTGRILTQLDEKVAGVCGVQLFP